MILQQILEALDGEMERLLLLREIVSGLSRPSVVPPSAPVPAHAGSAGKASKVQSESQRQYGDEEAPEVETTGRKRGRPRVAGATRGRKRAQKGALESSALRGSIPNAPVVVPAAQVQTRGSQAARQGATKPAAQPKPEPGSLGSMIRALRLEALQ